MTIQPGRGLQIDRGVSYTVGFTVGFKDQEQCGATEFSVLLDFLINQFLETAERHRYAAERGRQYKS